MEKVKYTRDSDCFSKLPGSPIAYWLTDNFLSVFNSKPLSFYGRTCQGLATGDNERYLRFWFECGQNINWSCQTHEQALESCEKWYPCTKGGSYRRWYGNLEYVINWEHDGDELRNSRAAVIRNPSYYFKEGYSWSTIASGNFSMRYVPIGSIFESKGSKCFVEHELFYYVLGVLNSCITQKVLEILSPTLDYHEGPVGRVPIIAPTEPVHEIVDMRVQENIKKSKTDWDAFETSWDFKKHPLI